MNGIHPGWQRELYWWGSAYRRATYVVCKVSWLPGMVYAVTRVQSRKKLYQWMPRVQDDISRWQMDVR